MLLNVILIELRSINCFSPNSTAAPVFKILIFNKRDKVGSIDENSYFSSVGVRLLSVQTRHNLLIVFSKITEVETVDLEIKVVYHMASKQIERFGKCPKWKGK